MTANVCIICDAMTLSMHDRKGNVVQVDLHKARLGGIRFNPKKDKAHVCESTKGLIRA